MVVFPELSLTGHDVDAEAVAFDDVRLGPLVDSCAAVGSPALVGAPAESDEGSFITTLAIDHAGARVAYRKRWLEGSEPRRFRPGDEPTVLDVDGWRLGLGICKDTGAAQHIAGAESATLPTQCAPRPDRPHQGHASERGERRGVAEEPARGRAGQGADLEVLAPRGIG